MVEEDRELRVMLVDDQPFARRGFRLMLRGDAAIRVIAEAGDGIEALAALRDLAQRSLPQPHIVLMDVRMPRLDGIETTRQIVQAHPAIRVIVLTTYDEDESAFGALAAGASGFLLKDVRTPDLLHAIRAVAAGDAILTPRITRRVLERGIPRGLTPERKRRADALFSGLTEREREVVRLIADGLSNAEVAERMVVEPASVRRYVSRVLAKLGLRDRVQIAIEWYRAGLG